LRPYAAIAFLVAYGLHAGRVEGRRGGVQFETLRPFLTGDEGASYAEAARTLERAEGALRVAVHRLRRRFGRCLRETLGDTVNAPADIDAELEYLIDVLARRHRASSLERPQAIPAWRSG
jgi:RNA polymerase sigma-70 factor (ECF subfamily)